MIKIYTYFHRRPDFADIQIRSIKKYLKEDYELTVFNNAVFDTNKVGYNKINEICAQHGVKVLDIKLDKKILERCHAHEAKLGNKIFAHDGSYINPNVAVAYSLCYIWENFMSKENDKVVFLQHDVFLAEPINFTECMGDNEICYIPQARLRENGTRIDYMWNTFFLIDVPKIPSPETMDWWCGSVDGIPVDVGGQTYKYLEDHPEVKKGIIQHYQISDFESQKMIINGKSVIHYYRGSNWDLRGDDWHKKKTDWLLKTLDI